MLTVLTRAPLSSASIFGTGGQAKQWGDSHTILATDRARNLLIRFQPGDAQESLSIDGDWLAGAELVVVRAIREGSERSAAKSERSEVSLAGCRGPRLSRKCALQDSNLRPPGS